MPYSMASKSASHLRLARHFDSKSGLRSTTALVAIGLAGVLVMIMIGLALYIYRRRTRAFQSAPNLPTSETLVDLENSTPRPVSECSEPQSLAILVTRNGSTKVDAGREMKITTSSSDPALSHPAAESPIYSQPKPRLGQIQASPNRLPASGLLQDSSKQPLGDCRIPEMQQRSTSPARLETENAASSTFSSETSAKTTQEILPYSKIHRGSLVTQSTDPTRHFSARTSLSSRHKYLLQISKSIPSPSLDMPEDFGLKCSPYPLSSCASERSTRLAHARSRSSGVVVLPGRSVSNSTSSNKTPLRATASVLSRWRKTRDLESDLSSPSNDLFDVLQTVSDLDINEE